MFKEISISSVLLFASLVLCPRDLGAQTKKDVSSAHEAAELRNDLAEMAARDGRLNQEVFLRLKASRNPSGLAIGREADFALAALDVGRRLAARGKKQTAELFFVEAEKFLTDAIATADAEKAPELVMLLQKRALIRARYLNLRVAAKADAERALKLQPESAYLKAFSLSLDNGHDERVLQYVQRKEGSR